MAKRLTTEDHLALLRKLRTAPEGTATDVAALEHMLKSSKVHGMVVKGAADLAEKWSAKSLVPALAAAAEDMSGSDGQKRDPGCEGKEAVLRILVGWEADVPDLYQHASQWQQRAPVMGGSVDVAAECRGLAAVGISLTRAGGPDAALARIIDLLVDEAAATRVRAAQALGIWRGPEAAPLLRLKALLGDESAEVLAEVLLGLLHQERESAVTFVTRFLDDDDTKVVEAAAMALGESRQPAALEPLTRTHDRLARDPVRTSILMAIALLRSEESLTWLLARIKQGRESAAVEALEAMRIYRGDEKIVARIREAVTGREGIERIFGEVFGA